MTLPIDTSPRSNELRAEVGASYASTYATRMDESPFPFQGPLEPADVRGRDDVVTDLVERVTARRVTALLGPRRFGKTSVLRRVGAELEAAGTTVVDVDLYEVSSMADLAVRLDHALATVRGPAIDRLHHFISGGEVNLGAVKLMFARRPSEQPDPVAVIHHLLDGLVAAAQRIPLLVVFDEFGGIDRLEGAAGLLRTKLQHHVRDVGLVFAGSQLSLMRAMFTDVARPFYGQAELVDVGPLTPGALRAIVNAGFRTTDRDPGDLATPLIEFTGGHPQRAMQLADAAWRHAVPGEPYRSDLWGIALDDVRRQTEFANETLFSRSQSNDQKLLRLVANGEPIFGAASHVIGLTPGSGQSSRDRLVDGGEIMRTGTPWRVVDPVYADWIRRRFPL